jgi:hypothetical protein
MDSNYNDSRKTREVSMNLLQMTEQEKRERIKEFNNRAGSERIGNAPVDGGDFLGMILESLEAESAEGEE